ncbi:hypothetical protein J5N97_022116 [Dioscorea zingiberensis]|uniref:Uncharacterized protein n=1 Tax=Dioscorea zingiberensis TaxID=325984 RepID=A0A9D5CA66_9LILI|nr:hypothetical protein J5N97_022116 [Dioscorea zingiberensis]
MEVTLVVESSESPEPRDDVLYPHLIVRETLVFSALLRLVRTMTQAKKVAEAERLIGELGLEKCTDSIMGSVRGSEAMDYFAGAGFSSRFPVNPADFMLDLAWTAVIKH